MLRILLALALLLFAPSTPAQDPAAPTTVSCPSCKGAGHRPQTCRVCDGDKNLPCPACAYRPFPSNRRDSKEWMPPAHAEAVLKLHDLATKQLDDAIKKMGGDTYRDRTKLKPGEVRCKANCFSGELLYLDGRVDCKVCKGGKSRCKVCKKGQVACSFCARRGSVDDSCDDCAGVGQLPNPEGLPFDKCPWCRGAGERACGSCDLPTHKVPRCYPCSGTGDFPCRSCAGTQKLPCSQCKGRGKYSTMQKSCDLCRKKGVAKCTDCVKGMVACIPCGGKGAPWTDCIYCDKTKRSLCNGCHSGAYLAWERSAEWALKAKQLDQAEGWALAALDRIPRRYQDYVKDLKTRVDDLDPRIEEMILEESAEEVKRLKKLLKRITAAK